jgi:type VI secretion system protein ImpH
MANAHRQSRDPLRELKALSEEPHKFHLFAALRLSDSVFSEQPRTGRSDRPVFESVRLGQHATLNFAPSSIASFSKSEQHKHWKLQTYLYGLFGPNGALPIHLTEYAMMRWTHSKDATFSRFVDIFHHRFATFFYRAWADAQPCVHFDRPKEDRFAIYIGALSGYGTPSLRGRDDMPDEARQFFCAHLANFRKNEGGLKSILGSFFGQSVALEQFVGHWIRLPEDSLWKLGARGSGELGGDLVLGSRVFDYQSRFRIVLGPVDYNAFLAFLPYGQGTRRLRSIVDSYIGLELSWDVQLKLKKDQVKPFILGRQGHLGWTSWLNSRRPTRDADQLVVDPVLKLSRQREMAKRDMFTNTLSLPTFGDESGRN